VNLSQIYEQWLFVVHPEVGQLVSMRIFAAGELQRDLHAVAPHVVVVLHPSCHASVAGH
jgi:hypothetical protein